MGNAAIDRAVGVDKARRDTARGAVYPRAVVIRQDDGDFHIQIWHSEELSELAKDWAGNPKTYTSHVAAFNAARREVHALRSRRHPAGQAWLKAGAS